MSVYQEINNRNILHRVQEVYNWLQNDECTVEHIIKEIVKKDWQLGDIAFSLGIENENVLHFAIRDRWEQVEIDVVHREESIEHIFASHVTRGGGKGFVQFCRCIGKWEKVNKKESRIYYFFSVRNCEGISNMYFQAVDKAYYEWILDKIFLTMGVIEWNKNVVHEKDFLERMSRKISEKFQEYMSNMFSINLNVITDLSGSYYEGQPCEADLVFQLANENNELEGVEFTEQIEVCAKNIRRIRKLLQMGKKGQYILATWDTKANKWFLKGLFSGTNALETSLIFTIISHMSWEMKLNAQQVICYQCGKHFIDCDEFKREMFNSAYKRIFLHDAPEKVKNIFDKATLQVHGTVLVVWDLKDAKDEVERLQRESTAILLNHHQVDEKYIESVTSIDGALCIDANGDCYGIGVILDGNVNLAGTSERGARYNSCRKYIKQCRNKNMKALAVVISEDKTINIFDTQSEGKEDEHG